MYYSWKVRVYALFCLVAGVVAAYFCGNEQRSLGITMLWIVAALVTGLAVHLARIGLAE